MSEQTGLNTLLDFASQGHHPLFHKDWIRESFNGPARRLSFARAHQVVEEGLKRLERHSSLDRKQTALGAFTVEERREFIRSFFKMLEYKTLDGLKELH